MPPPDLTTPATGSERGVIAAQTTAETGTTVKTEPPVSDGNPTMVGGRSTEPSDGIDDPEPTVLLIGDSSMAGLRWYEGVSDGLTGATYILDVESCRRVVEPSCEGREERVPSTAFEALASAVETPVDVLIVMAGYNDEGRNLEPAVRLMGEAATELGIETLVWMRFTRPDPAIASVDTAFHNESLERAIDGPSPSSWILADWPGFSATEASVFEDDGIHLTRSGAEHLVDFLSAIVIAARDPLCDDPDAAGCSALPFLRSAVDR